MTLHSKVFRLGMAALFAAATFSPAAMAGPFVTSGGKAATPTAYIVTIKTIEFRRSDGTYYTFFSGSQTIDIGSTAVAAGGVGGYIGAGQPLPAGTYDGLRVTVSRDFSITASATAVGTASADCGTGGSTNATLDGYTVQVVSVTTTPTSRTLSIPPEANAAINGVSGMAIVGASNDLQITTSLSSFTVLATDTVPPSFGVQFDVANSVEFLSTAGPVVCHAIILPPTITYTTPTGTTTFAGPL